MYYFLNTFRLCNLENFWIIRSKIYLKK